jgi:hypothetical protein
MSVLGGVVMFAREEGRVEGLDEVELLDEEV